MKFSVFIIIILLSQISFAQRSDLTLNVMKQLNIDEADCDGLFAEMQLSYNKDETVIVIPKIGEQIEDYTALDTYVALVNNKTNEIKSLFFESYKTNGWRSDAIFIYEISIDTTSYLIDKNKSAFGVVLKTRSMSQPNPYYESSISLFIADGKELKNILKNYTLSEYGGETDMNCNGKFQSEKRLLSMSKNVTNGFYDITSTNTYETIVYEEKDDDCQDTVTDKKTKKITLTYENGKYKKH